MPLNLGTLQFGLGVNTSGLDDAIRAIESFGRTVQGAQTASNRGFSTAIDLLRQQENSLLSGMEKIAQAQARVGNMRVDTSFIDRLNLAYAELQKRMVSTAEGLDATKIDRANAAFQQAVASIMREAQAADQAAAANERNMNAIMRASEAARNLGTRITTAPATPALGGAFSDQRNQLAQQLEEALATFRTQMSTATAETAGQFQRQWTEAIGNVRRSLTELSRPTPAAAGWTSALGALGDASLLATGRLGGLSLQFFALRQVIQQHGVLLGAAAAATVTLGGALYTLGDKSLEAYIKLQKVTYGLEAINHSTVQTNSEMNFLQNTAHTAGVRFDDLAQSYQNFYVAAHEANLSLKDTHDVFQTVTQAAGVFHLSGEQVRGTMLALEQMLSKGTVQTQELRLQLGNQLPGAFTLAANAMGVTTSKLQDMMQKHQLMSDVFLPKFAAELRKAYGLDLNKQVDTLQANINRVHNSFLNFFNQLAGATGLGTGASNFMANFSKAIDSLTAHLPQAIGLIGALAGAMASLAAVTIATSLLQALSALGPFIALLTEAKTATEALTVVQMGLNIVLSSSLLGILLRVGIAIGGAVLGYNLMEKATKANMAATQDSIKSLNDTIDAQLRLGTQIASTNEYIAQQIRLQQVQATAAYQAAAAQRDSLMAQGGPGIVDYAESAATKVGSAFHGGGGSDPGTVYKNRVDAAKKAADDAMKTMNELGMTQMKLDEAMKLPEAGTGRNDAAAAKTSNKGVDAAAEAYRKLVQDARDAQDALRMVNQAMADGVRPNFEYIDALTEARHQLAGMSTAELGHFKEDMGMAGASTEAVARAMAVLKVQTIAGQAAMKLFHQSVDDADKAMMAIAGNTRMANYLKAGGDPNKSYMIDSLNKAKELINQYKQIDAMSGTTFGTKYLEAYVTYLHSIGVEGANATLTLQNFFAQQAKADMAVKALQALAGAWTDVGKSIGDAQMTLQAYGQGGSREVEQLTKFMQMRDQIQQFYQNQINSGASPLEAQGQTQVYAQQLAYLFQINEQISLQKNLWDGVQSAWNDAFHGMFDNLEQVIQGSKTLKKAIIDLSMTILNDFANKALDTLAQVGWDKLFNPNAGAAGILGGSGKNGVNALAAANMQTLALAANAAAIALTKIAATAGVSPMGGSGGGILGAIVSGIGAIFGGSGVDSVGVAQSNFDWASSAFSSAFPRASGGPGTAGKAYSVREMGAGDEIFFPGTQGTFAKPNSATNVIHVDASTYIDARGATVDAVQQLKEVLAQRDRQLRAQLPYIIDQRVLDSKQRRR